MKAILSSTVAMLLSDQLDGAGVEITIKDPMRECFGSMSEGLRLLADSVHGEDAVQRVKFNPGHPRNNNGAKITRGGYRR